MQIKDFEYFLTKAAWDDPSFAKQLESDPIAALQSKGIAIPKNIKLRVILQRKDTIYFAIPPVKKPDDPLNNKAPEAMDVWSSGNFFIWLAPTSLKFALLTMRNSVPEIEV